MDTGIVASRVKVPRKDSTDGPRPAMIRTVPALRRTTHSSPIVTAPTLKLTPRRSGGPDLAEYVWELVVARIHLRRILLIVAMVVTTIILVVWSAATALWISVGGTLGGERVTLGIVLQIGLAVLSCVGLVFLIRSMFRAAKKA